MSLATSITAEVYQPMRLTPVEAFDDIAQTLFGVDCRCERQRSIGSRRPSFFLENRKRCSVVESCRLELPNNLGGEPRFCDQRDTKAGLGEPLRTLQRKEAGLVPASRRVYCRGQASSRAALSPFEMREFGKNSVPDSVPVLF
jgi:hypothetical protein